MGNGLSKIEKGELKSVIAKGDLGSVLQPLIKEIHLFDSYVAGTTHLESQDVLDTIKAGDLLTLEREENKFDMNAILIKTEKGIKIGYVPEKDNVIFARLMDAGKLLRARIKSVEKKHDFSKISIGIFLVDV